MADETVDPNLIQPEGRRDGQIAGNLDNGAFEMQGIRPAERTSEPGHSLQE